MVGGQRAEACRERRAATVAELVRMQFHPDAERLRALGVARARRAAAGDQLGWGFQFQNPVFVAGLAVVVFLFALSLLGVFEIGGIAVLAGLGAAATWLEGLGRGGAGGSAGRLRGPSLSGQPP